MNRVRSLKMMSGMYERSFWTSMTSWKLPLAASNRARSWMDSSSVGPLRSVFFSVNGLWRCGSRPVALRPSPTTRINATSPTSQNRQPDGRPQRRGCSSRLASSRSVFSGSSGQPVPVWTSGSSAVGW